jgi:hypothetical protein
VTASPRGKYLSERVSDPPKEGRAFYSVSGL